MRSPSSRTSTPDPARPQQLRVLHTGEALATRIRFSRSDRDGYDSDGQGRSDTVRDGPSSVSSSRGGLSVEALMMPHGYMSGSRPSLLHVHSRSSTPPQSPQVTDRTAIGNPSPLASRTPSSMRATPDSSSHDTPSPGSSLARRGRGLGSILSLTVPGETGDAAARMVPVPPVTGAGRVRPNNLFISVNSRPASADVDGGGGGAAGCGGAAGGAVPPHGLSIVKPNEGCRPSHQRHGSYGSSRPSSGASLSRSLAGCSLGVSLPGSSRPSSAVSSVASNLGMVACPSSGSFGSGGFGGKQISQRKLLRIYDSVLSEVAPRIFVGADEAARDLHKLQQAGITHVVNCAAATCANHFEAARGEHPDAAGDGGDGAPLEYLSLYLQDSLREDVSRAFYDSIEFIDDAIQGGGRC